MAGHHIIEEAVFDISFGSEEEAFETQVGLDVFIKDRLMQVVDEVFTEYSGSELVWRLEPLEIDLGVIAYAGYQDEMEQRLRARLKPLLQEKLDSLKTESTVDSQVMTRQASEREQVEYFLQHGHLPWNAGLGNSQAIDQMFQRVMQMNGKALIAFLKTASRREMVIRRLVVQFSDMLPEIVLQAFVPSQPQFFRRFIGALQTVLLKTQFVGNTEKDVFCFVWEHLMHEVLQSEGWAFDQDRLVSRIVQVIAQHRNESDARIVSRLSSIASVFEEREDQRLGLVETLRQLKGKEGARPDGSDRRSQTTTFSQGRTGEKGRKAGVFAMQALLRTRLVAVLDHGMVNDIMDVWPKLVRDECTLLENVLRDEGRRAKVRRTIAHDFPEPMIREIMDVLEPGGKPFIEAIVHHHELFQRGRDEQPEEEKSLRRHLWEFTLAYLIVEQGSRFNKKSYLGSLIRQMAAHHNIQARDLFRSLTMILEDIDVPYMLKTEMLQLLRELDEGGGVKSLEKREVNRERRDESQATVTLVEDNASRGRTLIDAYDFYYELWKRVGGSDWGPVVIREEIFDTGQEGRKIVGDLIDSLERKAPWLLLRLYRELQAGMVPLDMVVEQLSGKDLRRLVLAFLRLAPGIEALPPVHLLQATESYAVRVQNLKRYYTHVLDCLLQNRVIDFEAIMHSNLEWDEQEESVEGLEVGQKDLSVDDSQRDIPELAHEFMQLRDALRQGVVEEIVSLWPLLRRRYPEQMKTVLRAEG
ncbi:MAG: hypothetical protein GKS05_12920 [Nitrospirales bacterium]|nr:hypothetical protein [Nitrospirales bacterium]